MSEHEFVELGPALRRGIAQNKTINIWKYTSYVSKAAQLAIGKPIWVSIAVTPSGRMRITPVKVPNENSVRIDPGGNMARISTFCETEGYRMGKYDVEARDGALYIQLERVTK